MQLIISDINYVGCFNSMLNNSTISLNSSLQECVDNCNKLESNFSALQVLYIIICFNIEIDQINSNEFSYLMQENKMYLRR